MNGADQGIGAAYELPRDKEKLMTTLQPSTGSPAHYPDDTEGVAALRQAAERLSAAGSDFASVAQRFPPEAVMAMARAKAHRCAARAAELDATHATLGAAIDKARTGRKVDANLHTLAETHADIGRQIKGIDSQIGSVIQQARRQYHLTRRGRARRLRPHGRPDRRPFPPLGRRGRWRGVLSALADGARIYDGVGGDSF